MPEPDTVALLEPYDAVLILGFGGPEGPDEVMPFLRRVTAGRGVPEDRLALVAEHYLARGGVSPMNAENRALVAALSGELSGRGWDVPVVLGNRNAPPYLADTLRTLHDDGARSVLTVLTSAYASYSSCRQYREDLAAALATLREEGRVLDVDKIRPYAGTAGFVAAWRELLVDACSDLPDDAHLLFVTHSIPEAMDETSGPGDGEGHLYVEEHLALAAHLLEAVRERTSVDLGGELVFCSRSGPPQQPWLEPDVGDRIAELAADGIRHVVLAPIGFTSDHMEVVQDLDTDAARVAAAHGVALVRVPTPRTHPAFVAGLVDLLAERAAQARGEAVVPTDVLGQPRPAVCPSGCCPNLRASKPAACGVAP